MARTWKVAFQDLASRFTGFSTPIFGASWKPPEPERNHVRRLIQDLEDRRVLFAPYDLEVFDHVIRSVIAIREQLTSTLQALPEGSRAAPSIRIMRYACRRFLTNSGADSRDQPRQHHRHWDYGGRDDGPRVFMALGELRATFGMHLAALALTYGIDVELELAAIMPPDPRADEQQD